MTIFLHNNFINYYYYYYTNFSFSYLLTFIMVGHLFQNYDTIFVRFFPTYTCNHSCKKPHVHRVARLLAFFPALWGFYFQVYDHFLTNAHIYAHKKSLYICVTNKHVSMRSQKSRRIWFTTELYRHQKTPSCTMELKSNFSLNQGWPQWPR